MKLLAIETTSKFCSVAYADTDGIMHETIIREERMHDAKLVGAMQDILNKAGMQPEKLEAIAVSAGPGSFTGIRIGVAAAKGFAFAQSLPVLFVPTLDALAYTFAAEHKAARIIATQFSHKTNLWYKVFDGSGLPTDDELPKFVDANLLPYFPDASYIGTAISLLHESMTSEKDQVPTASAIAMFAQHANDRLLTAPLYAANFTPINHVEDNEH